MPRYFFFISQNFLNCIKKFQQFFFTIFKNIFQKISGTANFFVEKNILRKIRKKIYRKFSFFSIMIHHTFKEPDVNYVVCVSKSNHNERHFFIICNKNVKMIRNKNVNLDKSYTQEAYTCTDTRSDNPFYAKNI